MLLAEFSVCIISCNQLKAGEIRVLMGQQFSAVTLGWIPAGGYRSPSPILIKAYPAPFWLSFGVFMVLSAFTSQFHLEINIVFCHFLNVNSVLPSRHRGCQWGVLSPPPLVFGNVWEHLHGSQ